jgi:anti-sigma regulatory factor (Ser/Thr protein kinase)
MTRVASDLDLPRGDPSGGLAFSVDGGVEACSDARRAVLAGDGAVPTSAREDILLLISELVTNAVRHADVGPDRSLRVELKRWPRRVRVEVAHTGPGFEHEPVAPSPEANGGWGLVLVDRIADRWGITTATGRTCVWFELRTGVTRPAGPGEAWDGNPHASPPPDKPRAPQERRNIRTASTRRDSLPVDGSPSLPKMLETYFSTARRVITSASAIP